MLKRLRGKWLLCVAAIATASTHACRENEPPPSHYGNLGSDEAPLLPPASARLDPAMKDGRAEWHPFREPSPDAPEMNDERSPARDGETAAVANAAEIETELRELLDEYNGFIAEEKYAEILDFFTEGQSEIVERLTKTLPSLVVKLQELNQVLPERDGRVEELVTGMALKAVLRLEAGEIRVVSDSQATGRLKRASTSAEATAAPAPQDRLNEIRFALGEDDYWYIEVPALQALELALPILDQSIAGLDPLIAGIRSGQTSGEAIAQQMGLVGQLLELFRSSGAGTSDTSGGTEE